MKIFSILRKDLQNLLRDRAEMAVLFLMPLAFIIPISLALGSGDGYGINERAQAETLTVVDYDRGPRALALLQTVGESLRIEKELDAPLIDALGLTNEPDCLLPTLDSPVIDPSCLEKAGHIMLTRSWRRAVLIIPEGFSQSVDDGQEIDITLLYDPAGDSVRYQQIEGIVRGAAVRLSIQNQVGGGLNLLNQLTAFAPENVRQSVEEQAAAPQSENQDPALRLEKISPSNYQLPAAPDTYQQTIPGYTVMFVFFLIATMTSSINAERINGTFRRLLSAPVSRFELLGGKVLTTLVIGLIQVLILFLVGVLAFGLRLGNDPLAFILLTLALVSAVAAIGLAASTTRLSGGMLAPWLIIAALLGGGMFPLDLMPPFLRVLSRFVPHSWALTGYQNLMVRGQGIQEVLPQIAVLAAFAVVFFLIALRRIDFETQETS